MKLNILILILCFSVLSCKEKTIENPEVKDTTVETITFKDTIPESIIVEEKFFSITTFSSLPKNFSSCRNVFSQNKKEFENSKYYFADDVEANAVISIDGKTIFLKKSSSFIEDEIEINVFSNGEYSAYVHSKEFLDESEMGGMIYSGELIIKDKTGKEIKIKVYGEGGC